MNDPRGSIWRKWDLHLHTPFTKLNNCYSIREGDVWEKFCEKIEKSDVRVFGITDYFSVENYFVFIEKFRAKYPDSKKVFFPNIELRLEVSVNRAAEEIHLHVIFNNKISKHEIEKFLAELKTTRTRNNANVSCKDLSSNDDFERASVRHADLRKKLENVFGNNVCYIIVAASNNSGLRPDTESPRKLNITDEIDKVCDAFFGGQQNIEYYLKTDRYDGDEGPARQKPVISGCDAHSFEDLESSLGKRRIRVQDGNNVIEKDITWIKADPTFDGLKEITYEPKDRVKIQEERPDEKKPYSVIDAVRFLDKRDTPEFSDRWIHLNQNLNSIIGGKSSGKSLLLYHIAKTIDTKRVDEVNKDKEYKKLEYRFEREGGFDFEVKWADGEAYKLKDCDKPNRPITYIPQLYLNRLAEDKKDELNSLVENMLLDSGSGYKEFRKQQKEQMDQSKSELSNLIGNYYLTKDKLAGNKDDHKKLGDRSAIEKNIVEIIKKIATLRAESKFSAEDEANYTRLQAELSDTNGKVAKSEEIVEVITFGKSKLQTLKINAREIFVKNILRETKDNFPTSSSEVVDKLADILNGLVGDIEVTIKNKLSADFKVIDEEQKRIAESNKKLQLLNEELKPLNEKIVHKSKLEALQNEKQLEEEKLKSIIEKQNEIEALEGKLSEELSLIISKYEDFFSAYLAIVNKNKQYSEISGANMTLSSSVKVKQDKFNQNFLEKINKKRSLSSQFGNCFNENGEYNFISENHLSNIKKMVKKLTSGEIEFNKGFDEEKAMYSLLDDHYYIDYDLTKDDDRLVDMSPGKMGIILFQLFLHLSQSEYPILIDQPEDNLDNKTVYKELNDFIKQKKVGRQIIIVSHNANLVVSTDSENIVVANQKGQESSEGSQFYKFAYVNGAIECSYVDESKKEVLSQKGIREHVCEILEGGKEAFEKRENKYGFRVQ